MIIDLLNICQHYSGSEANILFTLLENGLNVPHFFCITEDFTEDELNNYLQNHFQHTKLFSIRLSLSFEGHENGSPFDSSYEPSYLTNIPKSALAYSAEKLFSEAREIADKFNNGYKQVTAYVIIQEAVEYYLCGNLHTAYTAGIINTTIIYIGHDFDAYSSNNNTKRSIYCHNDIDGILFAHEPKGAQTATLGLISQLLEISKKIKKLFKRLFLDIRFAFDYIEQKIYIITVHKITELPENSSEITVLDTKGVCNYYPGVTEPLLASASMAISKKIMDDIVKFTGYSKKIPASSTELMEYVNGRLYFNVNKLKVMQKTLYLNEDTEEYIHPSIRKSINHIKECRSLSAWRRKRKTALRINKLLEENLRQRNSLCSKLNTILDELSAYSANTPCETVKSYFIKNLSALSECMNANQLNTLYINFNKKLLSRCRPSDKKYISAKTTIDKCTKYRTELKRFHYSFLRLLRIYSLHMGNDLVKKGVLQYADDINMLTCEEAFSQEGVLNSHIQKTICKRKETFSWYKSMPGFTQLVFNESSIFSAPEGKVDLICSVTEKSRIRGCGLNLEKAEYPAEICERSILPKICSPEKIYVVNKFPAISENVRLGGLIIAENSAFENMVSDLTDCSFPVICGAEHALSIIKNGDIVSMDSSSGNIHINHKHIA